MGAVACSCDRRNGPPEAIFDLGKVVQGSQLADSPGLLRPETHTAMVSVGKRRVKVCVPANVDVYGATSAGSYGKVVVSHNGAFVFCVRNVSMGVGFLGGEVQRKMLHLQRTGEQREQGITTASNDQQTRGLMEAVMSQARSQAITTEIELTFDFPVARCRLSKANAMLPDSPLLSEMVLGVRLKAVLKILVKQPPTAAEAGERIGQQLQKLPTLLAQRATCFVDSASIPTTSCPDIREHADSIAERLCGLPLEQAVGDLEVLCHQRVCEQQSWQRLMAWSGTGKEGAGNKIRWSRWERLAESDLGAPPKSLEEEMSQGEGITQSQGEVQAEAEALPTGAVVAGMGNDEPGSHKMRPNVTRRTVTVDPENIDEENKVPTNGESHLDLLKQIFRHSPIRATTNGTNTV
eukprot:TRINITY_DN40580_c0_g1_i1.p1 TRINITY_DN40580_c0_g1~~TRINITY_DN40580_c0_g1_i1.p1  ORF type:complete len:407 (+),score=83.51 TRINITY_DN40580_c0_g1_i1:80-1300(+)